MKIYLVCFDITDDKARNKVGKILLGYGERVQRSVFEIVVNKPKQLQALKVQLQPFVSAGDDLRFYYLSPATRKESSDIHNKPIADFPAVLII